MSNNLNDNWERVQEIFLAAADLPAVERAAFLAASCHNDTELRADVESLLHADTTSGAAFAAAIESEATLLLDGSLLVGQRLGAYRIIREIGRGGMGAVYLAERDDDQYHKQVAIKVVKRGMDTVDLLKRFRNERQILASLDHPYIARLLDGGSSLDGRPFLVMDLVDGKPIDRFCQDHNLSIHDRCRLFLRVCEGVSHAHRNLIVHCDLKPGNILITPDGSPKLLDFGVAKILHSEAQSGNTHTWASSQLLTPDYASPEQIRGANASTAMDVYALGGILYQLLAGVKPHRISSSSPIEWERVICESETTRPSIAYDQRGEGGTRWRRQLEGDLDNIVLMAMRKEVARRYDSVDHFAEDIRRYLDCRVVLARPDSVRYRTSKFLRRHRLAVTAVGLVIVSMGAGTTVAISQARKAESETQRANQRLNQMVDLADGSLSQVYSRLERLSGTGTARRELVGNTLEFLEKLSREAGDDLRLRNTLATAYLRVGDLQADAGSIDLKGDVPGALKSYRAGASLLEPALQKHPEPGVLNLWLDMQQRIGAMLSASGDVPQAVAVLTRALETGPQSSDPDALRHRANLYLWLSRAILRADKPQGLRYANQYMEAITALLRQFPQNEQLRQDLSSAHTQVGWAYISAGDLDSALPHYEAMVALREQLAQAHPHDAVYRRALMMAYQHIAGLHGSPIVNNLGHPDIARQYYAKARGLFEEAYAADPELSKYNYAGFLLRDGAMGVSDARQSQPSATLRKSISLYDALRTAAPDVVAYSVELSIAYDQDARHLLILGRYAEALTGFDRSLQLVEQLRLKYPLDPRIIEEGLSARQGKVRATMLSGDYPGALKEARTLLSQSFSPADLGAAYLALASVHRNFGQWSQARDAATQSVTRLRPILTGRSHDPNVAPFEQAQKLLAECAAKLISAR